MSQPWPDALRRRKLGEALHVYARLLVEHERVRRLRAGNQPAKHCVPGAAAWRPLHDVAVFQAAGHRVAPLTIFCGRFPDADGPQEDVPCAEYLAVLHLAMELAGDGIVQHGGEPPWGAGQPRAPESPETFDAVCRALRDCDADASGLGSLAAVLDAADLRPVPPPDERVVFDAAEYVLVIGDVPIAVPEGRERDFLRSLVAATKIGRIVPVEEHGRRWKGAVDALRRRIRRATGKPQLRLVVLAATGAVGGYRLHPDVEIRFATDVSLRFLPPDQLDAIAHPVRGRSKKPSRHSR